MNSTAKVPYSNISVVTARHDLILAEGYAGDCATVSKKSAGTFSLFKIPHLCELRISLVQVTMNNQP